MERSEFEKRLKEYLYIHSGTPNDIIDKTVEQEQNWLDQYYNQGVETGDFVHALDLAEANFSLWI